MTIVNISLTASNLKNVAGLFKGTSDPYAAVYIIEDDGVNDMHEEFIGKEIGQTEVIKNCLSPNWCESFVVEYQLGANSHIIVKIFDEINKEDEDKEMGMAKFENIDTIIGMKGHTKGTKLSAGGTLYIRIEKVNRPSSLLLKMSGKGLKKKQKFMRRLSNPFFEMSHTIEGKKGIEWKKIYKSKALKNNLNPKWSTSAVAICVKHKAIPIRLDVYDYATNGGHEFMGNVETTLEGILLSANNSSTFTLRRKGNNVGELIVDMAEIYDENKKNDASEFSNNHERLGDLRISPSIRNNKFLDYVKGDCDLRLCVGIDFTRSNGSPKNQESLHYLSNNGNKNDYEKAINAIGNILANFNRSKKFPVWGFGAKFDGELRNIFQCGKRQEVDGVNGILEAYRETLQNGLVMSGPTNIAEILETAASFARHEAEIAKVKGNQKYTILLILTNGNISDTEATVKVLNHISVLPLSIVIVGIGTSNFSDIDYLDDVAETSGRPNILKFVKFNNNKDNIKSLTAELLAEIPYQLVDYFSRNGIPPLPAANIRE